MLKQLDGAVDRNKDLEAQNIELYNEIFDLINPFHICILLPTFRFYGNSGKNPADTGHAGCVQKRPGKVQELN